MTVTIGFGWWLAPLAITLAALVWHRWVHRDDTHSFGYGGIGNAFGQLLTFSVALIVSLIAWLIWALAA